MQQLLTDPYIWLALVAGLSAIIFLLRGLKTSRWLYFSRYIVALSCLAAGLVLLSAKISMELIQFIGVSIIILSTLAILADFILGLSLRVKNAVLLGKGFSKALPDYLVEICNALESFSQRKIGALIILERKNSLAEFISGGILIDCEIKTEILAAIFSANSPIHDGAVIVANGRIKEVKSVLSLKTNATLPMGIGTRHRAAIGITERTDAIALVASEERGELSIASLGTLIKPRSQKELIKLLQLALKGKNFSSLKR
jgi:DNA integrity scanning protein DisA with diadenylate cyclase activity